MSGLGDYSYLDLVAWLPSPWNVSPIVQEEIYPSLGEPVSWAGVSFPGIGRGPVTAPSVAIATQDQLRNLLSCLRPVSFAQEWVIVDDCSSDDTVEKAKGFGAREIVGDSGGSFHENKNVAIDEATGHWILSGC